MKTVHTFQCKEAIRAEAREWVLKFDRDIEPSKKDIGELREWASRSPVHKAELERATAFWRDADLLSELAVPSYRRSKRRRFGLIRSIWPNGFLSGGNLLGGKAVLAAVLLLGVMVAGSAWFITLAKSTGNGVYQTAIGEQKVLTLADSSQIELDTNSRVQVDYSKGLRKIRLLQGKAHFVVAKNPDRPFEVYAAGGMVRAVGTAFMVSLDQHKVKVVVDEGKVQLARVPPLTTVKSNDKPGSLKGVKNVRSEEGPQTASSPNVFLSLEKGQSVLFDEHSQKLVELADQDLSKELTWRKGQLIFVNDSLQSVVSEVSRYTDVNIEIVDPELAELKVGGRFRTGELDALLDVLDVGFGVQISYIDKKHIQLHSANGK